MRKWSTTIHNIQSFEIALTFLQVLHCVLNDLSQLIVCDNIIPIFLYQLAYALQGFFTWLLHTDIFEQQLKLGHYFLSIELFFDVIFLHDLLSNYYSEYNY